MILPSITTSPPLFRLNVIFHKFLLSECYEELSQDDIEDYIRFIAVNGNIQKSVPPRYRPFVISESSLSWYNPYMQHNRFCESSVFFHAWKNPESFLEQPYIGFFHYDMVLKKEAIDFLVRHTTAAEAAGKQVVFAPYCLEGREHINQVISLAEWNLIVNIYNQMFGTNHTIFTVIDTEIPLYHTFVLHRDLFRRMMSFAEIISPRLFEMIGYDTRHLPFMLERMHAVFLALQRQDGVTGEWLTLPGIVHKDNLKDPWQNEGAS
jgi:hypothetical protein